jgi:flagellar protein FlhE
MNWQQPCRYVLVITMLISWSAVSVAQQSPARTSGTYVADAVGATITTKNIDYATRFKVGAMVPPGSTITKVSWHYGVSSRPIGFEAALCWHDQQHCWNITDGDRGSTNGFNGKDATQELTLYYRIKGSGALEAPSQGQSNQIIVSYDLAR